MSAPVPAILPKRPGSSLNERPRGPSIAKAKAWRLEWDGVTRKFDIKAKPVQWLGLFLDCRMNWQAHVKHRLALGHHRLRTMVRIMTANGIRRKLTRKVGWVMAMSAAAYGIEAIWEGHTGASLGQGMARNIRKMHGVQPERPRQDR
jgi:hypothetical protein